MGLFSMEELIKYAKERFNLTIVPKRITGNDFDRIFSEIHREENENETHI